jgi:hypothetical protein
MLSIQCGVAILKRFGEAQDHKEPEMRKLGEVFPPHML